MKYLLFSISLLMIILGSCDKKTTVETEAQYIEPQYDTTAVDSFSAGAISVDVANQIRRSSIAYQDSLREAAAELEKAKLEQQLKDKQVKEEKDKEAKAKEDRKKDEQKPKASAEPASAPKPEQN